MKKIATIYGCKLDKGNMRKIIDRDKRETLTLRIRMEKIPGVVDVRYENLLMSDILLSNVQFTILAEFDSVNARKDIKYLIESYVSKED